MGNIKKAYLDIETSFTGNITVVGIFRNDSGLLQLVGGDIKSDRVIEFLDGTTHLITYNGDRFDIPVIRQRLGVDLSRHYVSEDLIYECHRLNLYGGLKRVEEQLNIDRESSGVDGYIAMLLWEDYTSSGRQESLERLIRYNRDDVLNLCILEKRLAECASIDPLPVRYEV